MSDLIDRQAAIDAVEFGITYAKAINKYTGEVKEMFKEGNKALNEAVERIKDLPIINPPQGYRLLPDGQGWEYYGRPEILRIGHWIEDGHYERCSECGEPTNEYHNYCPNCGAKMYDHCGDCQEFSCDYCPNCDAKMEE